MAVPLAAERFDTVVIGAGMSGLAAGIRLAQFDQRVLVLDRHYLWGGLNSYYKRGGRRYDVGLHALTNYVRPDQPGYRRRPLGRVLRQLRIAFDELALEPQSWSRTLLPGVELRFSNDFELLRHEIAAAFPGQVDGFDRLVRDVAEYPEPGRGERIGARRVLERYLTERPLVELLLVPTLWYGSPTPRDIEWDSFVVLFKSLYEEGFARPRGGVRTLLDLLRGRFLELGGELRMRAGVRRILHERGGSTGRATGVELDDGSVIAAERVISSAGWVETLRLCGPAVAERWLGPRDVGELSFVETLTVVDRPLAALGHEATICFFNLADRVVYERPWESVDLRAGVVCCPDNYGPASGAREGLLRLTLLANHEHWCALPEERYRAEKDAVWSRGHEAIASFAPDVRPHEVARDVFTPRTIEHFTGHVNGAVYGSPIKHWSGETPVPGLFVCGTDQGHLGIVGALLSGVAVANRHALVSA